MAARSSTLSTLAGITLVAGCFSLLTGARFFILLAILGLLLTAIVFVVWILRGPHQNPFDPD